ncbi:macrophage mannose receptor 1-like [Mizuhopecten yessoensis]|uniref:Macrophage mannose receptor 1 n=1 Tax=Mizuhopecten yessoensis TaxID=6573 RepID=A0A210PYH1_MIZYE|nr:macrophage mannose receptor 1-like [Mizuhopecten yessoensis]OWF41489.1 Macrophage mannose receptor 1 [Mizuhopecten yessoensis]
MLKVFLLLTALIGVFGDTVDLGCNPGWYPNAGYCYLFNTNKRVTHQQAADECNNYLATLVRVESANEKMFIDTTIPQFTSDGFWTDMTDLRFDGTSTGTGVWEWGGYEKVNMSAIAWEKYPTNNPKDSCGAINIQGVFQNWRCDQRLGYICELDVGTDGGCPFGWMFGTDTCFYFSNTSDPSLLLSWTDAKAMCAAKVVGNVKGKLVTLDRPIDAAYIVNEMPEIANSTIMYWTGLTKTATAWAWDGGDPYNAGYFSWATEPDHINNNEHCAILKTDGKFSDQNCNRQMNFVCRLGTTTVNSDYYMGCNGWTRAGHKCYQIYDGPKSSWTDANSKCQSLSSRLLKVETLDERDWVEWQLTDESHPNVYWSGLNDRATEGTYRWADGALANSSLIRWNQEPNSWFGDEDCAGIRQDGNYNDRDCFLQAPAICEYTGSPCPTGWVTWAGTSTVCYYVTAVNQTFTWDEANTFCSKDMAQIGQMKPALLAVNSQAEQTFINNLLTKQALNPKSWWTGLNDVKNEGIWTYPDRSNLPPNMAVIPWNSEPNDKLGNKDCVMLAWSGRYIDINCKAKIGFICEKWPYGLNPNKASTRSLSSLLIALVVSVTFILH